MTEVFITKGILSSLDTISASLVCESKISFPLGGGKEKGGERRGEERRGGGGGGEGNDL